MRISHYFASLTAGVAYAAVIVSCNSGPLPEETAKTQQARQTTLEVAVNPKERMLNHPLFRLYSQSCAACHGEYGAGIGKPAEAGARPIKMRETLSPYNFRIVEGTRNITPYDEDSIVDAVRNGNDLMPSFLDSKICGIFNVRTLTPAEIQSIADFVAGPLRELQRAITGERYNEFRATRKMSPEDLKSATAYIDSKLSGNRHLALFRQTCGTSVCHGPDGNGVYGKRKLFNYSTGAMDTIESSPMMSHISRYTVKMMALEARMEHMPSFNPKASPSRRAKRTLTEAELDRIADALYLLRQKEELQIALNRGK